MLLRADPTERKIIIINTFETHIFSLLLKAGESVANEVITGFGAGLIGGIIVLAFATMDGRPADV